MWQGAPEHCHNSTCGSTRSHMCDRFKHSGVSRAWVEEGQAENAGDEGKVAEVACDLNHGQLRQRDRSDQGAGHTHHCQEWHGNLDDVE